jgi:hypothetical protein
MNSRQKEKRRLEFCGLIDQLDGSKSVKRHSLVVVVVVILAVRFGRRCQVTATRHSSVGGFGTSKRSGSSSRRRQQFLVG